MAPHSGTFDRQLTNDGERHVFDSDGLTDWIDGAKQLPRRLVSNHSHLGIRPHFLFREHRAAFNGPVTDLEISGCGPHDARGPVSSIGNSLCVDANLRAAGDNRPNLILNSFGIGERDGAGASYP